LDLARRLEQTRDRLRLRERQSASASRSGLLSSPAADRRDSRTVFGAGIAGRLGERGGTFGIESEQLSQRLDVGVGRVLVRASLETQDRLLKEPFRDRGRDELEAFPVGLAQILPARLVLG